MDRSLRQDRAFLLSKVSNPGYPKQHLSYLVIGHYSEVLEHIHELHKTVLAY